jgi:hypothetical protein
MKFTFVFELTSSPKQLIASLIANKADVEALYIVYPDYDGNPIYPEWARDEAVLGVPVYFVATFDPKTVDGIIVNVPANCELKLGAFESIRQHMSRATESQTHFALTPHVRCETHSLFYGFLFIMQTIDWIWNRIYERNKLIQTSDVQARFVIRKGRRSFVPEPKFIWRFWNTAVIPKVQTSSAVLHLRNGWSDVVTTLKYHSHQGFGLWLIPYLSTYLVLAVTWNAFVYNGVMAPYTIGMWLAEILVCYLICSAAFTAPRAYIYYLLFPVYWLLYPFVLIHARWK